MNEIIIKTPEEIEKMRELGKLVAEARSEEPRLNSSH